MTAAPIDIGRLRVPSRLRVGEVGRPLGLRRMQSCKDVCAKGTTDFQFFTDDYVVSFPGNLQLYIRPEGPRASAECRESDPGPRPASIRSYPRVLRKYMRLASDRNRGSPGRIPGGRARAIPIIRITIGRRVGAYPFSQDFHGRIGLGIATRFPR